MKLPYELQREALLWLPGGKETTELRTVSKQWNGILERHVAVCCVHRYLQHAHPRNYPENNPFCKPLSLQISHTTSMGVKTPEF